MSPCPIPTTITITPRALPTNGSPSFIDLTMCDPSSFMDYTWSTYDNVCGSDHYPIIIQNNIITHNHTPRWNTDKANWEKLCQLCSIELIKEKSVQTLITIAEECIPKNSIPNKKKKNCGLTQNTKKQSNKERQLQKNSKKNLSPKIVLNINKKEQNLTK